MSRRFRWTVLITAALLATLGLTAPVSAVAAEQANTVGSIADAEAGCDLLIEAQELSGKCEVRVDVLGVGQLKVTCTGFIFDLQRTTTIASGKCKIKLTTAVGTAEAECSGDAIEFDGSNTITVQQAGCEATLNIGGQSYDISCLNGPLAVIDISTLPPTVTPVNPTTFCTISPGL